MSGKTDVGFPEWVEKYRGPGKTIKKIKSGYALYQCTSKYVPGHTPKSVQTYLGFIFGGFEEIYIRSCFLTYQDADRYIRFLETANPKRLQTAKGVVEREMRRAIPNEAEYDHVIRLLMLCVVDAEAGNGKRPGLSVFLQEILEKNKLRFD